MSEPINIPFNIDEPLDISLNTNTGELTLACYQFVSGVPTGAKLQLHFSPQALQTLRSALAKFDELGTTIEQLSTPYNVQ